MDATIVAIKPIDADAPAADTLAISRTVVPAHALFAAGASPAGVADALLGAHITFPVTSEVKAGHRTGVDRTIFEGLPTLRTFAFTGLACAVTGAVAGTRVLTAARADPSVCAVADTLEAGAMAGAGLGTGGDLAAIASPAQLAEALAKDTAAVRRAVAAGVDGTIAP